MQGINKVILVGTLGADPEVRYSAKGTAFATLSVATNESWNDKQTGEKQEHTEWHRVVLSGRLAEVAGEYLTKSSQVYLEGKNNTRKWQDNDGNDRYTTEVRCFTMQMLGGGTRNNGGGQQGGGQNQNQNRGGGQNQNQNRGGGQQGGGQNQSGGGAPAGGSNYDDFDDDIPF